MKGFPSKASLNGGCQVFGVNDLPANWEGVEACPFTHLRTRRYDPPYTWIHAATTEGIYAPVLRTGSTPPSWPSVAAAARARTSPPSSSRHTTPRPRHDVR